MSTLKAWHKYLSNAAARDRRIFFALKMILREKGQKKNFFWSETFISGK
jgi:hypothetical protein